MVNRLSRVFGRLGLRPEVGQEPANESSQQVPPGQRKSLEPGHQQADSEKQVLATPGEQADTTAAGEPEAVLGDRENSTRFRVLHLSDIHFGSYFDVSIWEYVSALVRRERPDVIACTGDIVDHGGLFMLATAKQQFEKLREESGVEFQLRCVPGNHDCGPAGNVKFWPFSSNFAAVFGPRAMRIHNFVPTYCRYGNWSFLVRWVVRVSVTILLYAQKFTVGATKYVCGVPMNWLPLTRDDDPDQIVFIYLDSNYQLRLASGNIDVKELMRLKSFMLNMRDIDGSRSFAPRIALVHHHPLPIPDAKITEGLTSFEPFLVLRNAGVLLRELNRCDVDLVLHGHKHYSSFARLGYSLDHRVEGEIAVLGTGSSGITHAEQGRNSVNFIDVFRSGRMAYTSIFFGGGAGEPVTELFRNTRYVHGMEMHKMRMRRRATERQGQWIQRVIHTVDIDPGGVAVVKHKVEKHHFKRDIGHSKVPLRISVSMGRVAPTTLELSEESVRAGHRIENPPQAPERDIRRHIDLGQPLAAATPPASYGYRYLSFNTYAITEWETVKACAREKLTGENRGRAVGMEFSSVVVRVPIENLVLQLSLPPNASAPDPQVRVMRWRTYPDVPLDDTKHFVETDESGWLYDSDTTEHEAGRIARTGENEWQLSISNPLVGHRYEIRWRVRDSAETEDQGGVDTSRRGLAEFYRKALLELDSHPARKKSAESFAKAFLEELCKPSFPSLSYQEDDDLEVAMFAYDDDRQELRLVLAHPGNVPSSSTLPLRVPLNEGVVGAAFKRTAVVCYVDPNLSGSRDDAAYLYDSAPEGKWQKPKWRFVVALPIFAASDPFDPDLAPLGKWSPAGTVGVMTISSSSPASGLALVAQGVAAGEFALDAMGFSEPENVLPTPAGETQAEQGPAHHVGNPPQPNTADGGEQPNPTETSREFESTKEGSDRPSTEPGGAGMESESEKYSPYEWSKVWAYAHILLNVLENPVLFQSPSGDLASGDQLATPPVQSS